MAARKVKQERVEMTAPGGTKVTVGAESVERYTALGYKSAAKKAPAKSESDKK
jgi:hypothetical protein